PGVIGTVGTLLGNAGVNIADMDVGRAEAGSALMLIAPSDEVSPAVIEALRVAPGITSVVALTS
ncbi:MAG: ACT domain-containing protein, partial [Ilumatobacteraceae bacterium]